MRSSLCSWRKAGLDQGRNNKWTAWTLVYDTCSESKKVTFGTAWTEHTNRSKKREMDEREGKKIRGETNRLKRQWYGNDDEETKIHDK